MNSATYRGLPCPPTSELVSKGYVLDYLRENGADDEAVSDLCELYSETFHGDWVWRYPITGEAGVQAVIFPVREGFLWIPCDYKQGPVSNRKCGTVGRSGSWYPEKRTGGLCQ